MINTKIILTSIDGRKPLIMCLIIGIIILTFVYDLNYLKDEEHKKEKEKKKEEKEERLSWQVKYTPDIACHYADNNNILSELGEDYEPQYHSIFFHETSCKVKLTSRAGCAIESAIRAHPDWDVYVLFSSPINETALKEGTLKVLQSYKKVKLMRVNIKKCAVGTPLEQLVLSDALNKSRWKVEHTSDVLRYLTLYKWGGIYMDLDVVVARSMAVLKRNWAARESMTSMGSAILAFSSDYVGRYISEAAVRDIAANFRGDVWGNNGPAVLTRVLKSICSTSNLTVMSSDTCKGFEIYGSQLFYPVSYRNGEVYFKPGNLELRNVYVYHVWNHLTHKLKVHKDSPYAKLAQRCFAILEDYCGQQKLSKSMQAFEAWPQLILCDLSGSLVMYSVLVFIII